MTSQHQPEEMEIKWGQIPHQLQNEGEDIDQCNKNVLDEGLNVPKKVHQFYFVKFRPYQEPSAASKIEQAEKLIRELNHDQLRITKKLEEEESFQTQALYDMRSLETTDIWLGHDLFFKRNRQKRLQVSLDRLCFTNKAYRCKTTEPCLLSEDEYLLPNHKLQFQMLHGVNKSLAEEKELIRSVKASKRRGHDQMCTTTLSLEEIDSRADDWFMEGKHEGDAGIKRPELEAEKYISNAAVKGKLWNSLGSKQTILNQLKVIGDEIDMLMKEQLEVRAKSGGVKKKLQRGYKAKDWLEKQLLDIHRRRKEACESILKLRKQYDEENAIYYQNRILLDNAMELAKKKDVAALEKLSCREVKKFMSKWNKNKAFRDDYKKRVLPSMEGRELSRDGRLRDPCEEPSVLVTPRIAKREAPFTDQELELLMKDVKAKASCQFIYSTVM